MAMDIEKIYRIVTPRNYPDNSDCFVVRWRDDFFMPFDIVKGLDNVPPDNIDFKRNRKKHWWVLPRVEVVGDAYVSYHEIDIFVKGLEVKEFSNFDKALRFCLKFRKTWLREQLKKK